MLKSKERDHIIVPKHNGMYSFPYISIEDSAGGAKPPAPPLNSYATHHLIPQALYNDEIVIGCGGFGIKPCGAPNLVIAGGFSNGYKKI